MKKLILLIIFIVGFLPLCSIADMSKNLPKKNAWALQFAINDNFKLSSFQGATISLLKHTNVKKALRFGFSGRVLYDGIKYEDYFYNSRTSRRTIVRYDILFSVDIQKIYYVNPKSKINLFYGWGPTVTYGFNKSNYSNLKNLRVRWTIGAKFALGAQWFLSNSISLHAEYGTSLTYRFQWNRSEKWQFGDSEAVSLIVDDSQTNSLNLSPSAVKLGLSAYF